MEKLPHTYHSMLTEFYERGGSATIDRFGHVITQYGPIQGPWVGWLYLVAQGLLGGENGKLILTELGQEMGKAAVAGQTTEAVE